MRSRRRNRRWTAAKNRVAAAVAQRDQMRSSISEADITQAQTQVYAAQVQLDQLNESMNKVINRGGFALSAGESLDNYIKVTELQRATAQAALDELLRGPTPNQLRVANARIALSQRRSGRGAGAPQFAAGRAAGTRCGGDASQSRSGQSG